MNNSLSVHQVCQTEVIQKLKESLKSKVCSLQSSRTASLWLQYLDMINILRNFIRVQRIGNWELHLLSLSDMGSSVRSETMGLNLKTIFPTNLVSLERKKHQV